MVWREIPVEIDKKSVLIHLSCYEDSPVYEEVSEEYEEIRDKVLAVIQPRAAVSFTEEKAWVLMTLGKEVTDLIQGLFDEGEYMGGMLADVIADYALFAVDQYLSKQLKPICTERRVGIKSRLSAPGSFPMERNAEILEQTDGRERLSVGITSGWMFDPVKSKGYILELTND